MRRYEVRVDAIVEADLEQMRHYLTSVQGAAFARRFTGQAIAQIRKLRIVPYRGTSLDDVRPGVRSITWKRSVIIVFRVVDDEHRVDVIGIFYRGRDVRTALSERLKD